MSIASRILESFKVVEGFAANKAALNDTSTQGIANRMQRDVDNPWSIMKMKDGSYVLTDKGLAWDGPGYSIAKSGIKDRETAIDIADKRGWKLSEMNHSTQGNYFR